ncbi:hypothetical protein GCM10009574_076410 [Streptomyces asiaticus]|uniref:Uncharacterized protein n=2 Tax=Streptomyces rhizosphaericus TaxID=114699 RepID=A0ABN1Q1B5_9ACTN
MSRAVSEPALVDEEGRGDTLGGLEVISIVVSNLTYLGNLLLAVATGVTHGRAVRTPGWNAMASPCASRAPTRRRSAASSPPPPGQGHRVLEEAPGPSGPPP